MLSHCDGLGVKTATYEYWEIQRGPWHSVAAQLQKQLRLPPCLGHRDDTALNAEAWKPLWDGRFISYGYTPRRGIADPMAALVLIFGGTSMLFSTGAAPAVHRVPSFPHPRQHLPLVLLMAAVLTGSRWCLTVVWMRISLMMSEAAHLFCACWPSVHLWGNVYWVIRFLLLSLYEFHTYFGY